MGLVHGQGSRCLFPYKITAGGTWASNGFGKELLLPSSLPVLPLGGFRWPCSAQQHMLSVFQRRLHGTLNISLVCLWHQEPCSKACFISSPRCSIWWRKEPWLSTWTTAGWGRWTEPSAAATPRSWSRCWEREPSWVSATALHMTDSWLLPCQN